MSTIEMFKFWTCIVRISVKREESIARTSKSFMNGLARTGDKIELNRSSVLETGSLTSGNSILNTVVNFLMNPCDREYLRLWHTSFKSEVIVSYLVSKNLYLLNVFCERWTEYAEWVDIEWYLQGEKNTIQSGKLLWGSS